MTNYTFNYIITIHNKESLISDVLGGIKKCARNSSKIYPVLDGCTDNTEKIIDQFQKENPELVIHKIYENDVHELKAINTALRHISHNDDFQVNIILQDDVVLNDSSLELHLESLFRKFNNKLGIISLRHGGDLSSFLLKKESCIFPIKNYVETIFGHSVSGNLRDLEEGYFVFKEIAIKSPICIPSYLIKNIGLVDEIYQPWDDIAYCYQSLKNGFKNGVFSISFISEQGWGSMRTKKQQSKHDDIVLKNLKIFREKNQDSLSDFLKYRIIDKKIYNILNADKCPKANPNYISYFKQCLRHLLYRTKMFLKK
jgi:glycosyltransferase involved in cell wall biosynthesis